MSVRTYILRCSAIGAICGAALAGVQHFGMPGPIARADMQAVVLTAGPAPAAPDSPAPDVAGIPAPAPANTAPAAALSPLGLPCGLTAAAEAMPGAMVALDIMDPCAPGARVDVTHGALSFSARTDAMGLLTLDVPALVTPAFFSVRLDTGAETTAMAGLPDLAEYDRAAITWTGQGALHLHAFVGGAAFGEPGHVWQERPARVAAATGGTGGFLTLLGDPAVAGSGRAQVFTSPRSLRGDVTLMAEVAITEETCGQPVRAQSLQMTAGGPVSALPVTLTLPGCDAVGEFLMLQNLFGDLRLAAN